MVEKVEIKLESQGWYQQLIEECKDIVVEGVFASRWALIETYHNLGKRILAENDNFERSKIYGEKICSRVSISLGKSRQTIQRTIQFARNFPDLSQLPEGKNISWHKICNNLLPAPKEDKDFEPKIYDIWNFQGIDDRFGQPHPGNIPAGIILNTLYYYTKEGDLVVDPMAGGGVTIDCCKHLKRKCLAYDMNPKRPDIKQNDVSQGYPAEAKGCNLIFLDPPYYKKKEEEYGEDSISALPEDEYWQAFEKIASTSFKCVKKGGLLALVMEPYIDYEDSTKSLWLFQYINIFLGKKWLVERVIDIPESSQRYQAFDVTRAKGNKQILTLRRQLIIFRK